MIDVKDTLFLLYDPHAGGGDIIVYGAAIFIAENHFHLIELRLVRTPDCRVWKGHVLFDYVVHPGPEVQLPVQGSNAVCAFLRKPRVIPDIEESFMIKAVRV